MHKISHGAGYAGSATGLPPCGVAAEAVEARARAGMVALTVFLKSVPDTRRPSGLGPMVMVSGVGSVRVACW